jgi:hypothetical protein
MDVKWYNDNSAKIAYQLMLSELDPLVAKMFPEYELSHFGVNRNDYTEEVVIKLHLNKLGTVRVVSTEPDVEYRMLK